MRPAQTSPALIPKRAPSTAVTPASPSTADILATHPLAGQNVRLSLGELGGFIAARSNYPHTWEARLALALQDAVRNNGGWADYGKRDGLDTGAALRRDYPEGLREYWRKLTGTCVQENAGWAGWYPLNPADAKDAAGNTYKFYATPAGAPDDVLPFIDAFPELVARLGAAAEGKMVGAKIPMTLAGFAGSNDRLVVHFYDPSLREKIAGEVRAWAADHGVTLMPRSHDWGIDRAPGAAPMASDPSRLHEEGDAGSFTERLARLWAQETAQKVATGTWTDAQLAIWLADTVRLSLKDAEF